MGISEKIKKLLVLSLTLAGLLFVFPLEAEAAYTTSSRWGQTRSDACTATKNSARRSADQKGTVTSVSDCECKKAIHIEDRNLRWKCSADAYYDPD